MLNPSQITGPAGEGGLPKGIPEELLSIPKKDEGNPNEITHKDFLKLMLAQLENQDPTNPQDTEKFMAQIAQFTAASGISQLQSDFKAFFEHMRSDQSLRASHFVGREVVVRGSDGYLPEQGELQAVIELESAAPNLTVDIVSPTGERIHRERLGERSSGEHPFVWDGVDEDGQRRPAGSYKIHAYVEDGDDRKSVTTLVGAPVTSVSLGRDGRQPMLSVAGQGEVSLADVRRIR